MTTFTLGIGLALPGLIDLCSRRSQTLLERLQLFRDSSPIMERESFLLTTVQAGIHDMLDYFSARLSMLDAEFVASMQEWCRTLTLYFQKALEALGDDGNKFAASNLETLAARVKFSLVDAGKLKSVRQDLEEWYVRFSRRALTYKTFRLDAREGDLSVSSGTQNVSGNTFLRPMNRLPQSTPKLRLPPLDPAGRIQGVEGCGLEIYTSPDGSERWALEHRYYDGSISNETERLGLLVAEIASRLSSVDPVKTGLLKCAGFSHDVTAQRYTIHFFLPQNVGPPRSLRALLSDPNNTSRGIKHSLNDRIRLATAISSAVLYVHLSDFVHKNVRPENILVFEKLADTDGEDESTSPLRSQWPYSIGTPFLVGYDGLRRADAGSQAQATSDWRQRIYLAPGRLRMRDNEQFHMKHDVYSLGVVLLEIALWTDFTAYSEGRRSVGAELRSTRDPKKVLWNQTTQVPRLLGDRYSHAVNACLSEFANEQAAHQLDDQDGLVQSRAYILHVIDQLERISL